VGWSSWWSFREQLLDSPAFASRRAWPREQRDGWTGAALAVPSCERRSFYGWSFSTDDASFLPLPCAWVSRPWLLRFLGMAPKKYAPWGEPQLPGAVLVIGSSYITHFPPKSKRYCAAKTPNSGDFVRNITKVG